LSTPHDSIAAYLMFVAGGNDSPSAAEITSVLSEVGIEADSIQLSAFLSEMEGKEIAEVIAAGQSKLMKGGAGGGGGSGNGATGGSATEEATEEEKPKEEEVDPMEGGMDMFGGGGDY
jgi:large subunit ribosomal protein LP2